MLAIFTTEDTEKPKSKSRGLNKPPSPSAKIPAMRTKTFLIACSLVLTAFVVNTAAQIPGQPYRISDRDVASMLRELEIDIAVDLKGFTANSRTGILALRAAPVQVNYLGYPGTMGAPYIDYLIADRHVIPSGHDVHYTERIVRLPDGRERSIRRAATDLAFSAEGSAPSAAPRPPRSSCWPACAPVGSSRVGR